MSPGPFESDATRTPERAEAVAAALAGWRRQLSTLGGPNTLLWYVEQPTAVLDLTTAHPGGVSMLLAGRPVRLSDLVRERAAFAEARARAADIRGRALSLAATRGLETSFLAAGMATWEHHGAPTPPHAPVLLRSCVLRPTDAGAGDFDVVLGDEVEVNPVLEQYLRSTAGIDLDTASLAAMATVTSGFDPYPVYAALGRLCEGLPGFTITPRMLVGTFPHGKLAMVGDLGELAEPSSAERLAGHTVLGALAARAVAATDGSLSEPREPTDGIPVEPAADLDPDPDPAGERIVLDADAAQSGVVEAVLRGEDVVVHAAAGTGTTQTIANVVAALAGQRNSVLLVAEQRSEIDDVRRRLESVGLGSLVANVGDGLFDHRGTLAQVVGLVGAPGVDESWADRLPVESSKLESRLRAQRDALRDHVAALHEVRVPWGVSVHEAQCAISELGSRQPAPASRVRIRGAALARLSRERLHELADELAGAAAVGRGRPARPATPGTAPASPVRRRWRARRRSSRGWPTAGSTGGPARSTRSSRSRPCRRRAPSRTGRRRWRRWPGFATPWRCSGRRSSTSRSTSTSPRPEPASTGRPRASSSAGGRGPAYAAWRVGSCGRAVRPRTSMPSWCARGPSGAPGTPWWEPVAARRSRPGWTRRRTPTTSSTPTSPGSVNDWPRPPPAAT